MDGTLVLREESDRLTGGMDLEIADQPAATRNVERRGETLSFDARWRIDTFTTITADGDTLTGEV